MIIKDMRKAKKPGKIKAYFNVDHGGFLLRDFKLMESDSGLWVAFPKRVYLKDNKQIWEPIVDVADPESPEGKKLKELLSALARDEYLAAK